MNFLARLFSPLLFILVLMFSIGVAHAQDIKNIYAAGGSYNPGAEPSFAGTALYAHAANGSGLYAFSLFDALPSTTKPFTVTTNVGIGVGQRVATLSNVGIYMPTAIGVAWTGSGVGYNWSTGALASIPVGSNFYIMPVVRVLKSSVGGAGYTPIVGLLFAFGN